jgi:photosystem I subunit 3
MKALFNWLLAVSVLTSVSNTALADVSGLTPCKDSPVFKRRLDGSVKKLNTRLSNYTEGTPAYIALEQQIDQTKARFAKYSEKGLLCGTDGLPHLIADGRLDHAGEFIIPGIGFIYIAGWIGWAGRSYLQFSKKTDKPNENEIIINVPVALGMMSGSFMWPLLAWKELINGQLLVSESEITVSPR